jgi:hypothetical protein
MISDMRAARAHVNWGRWIATCPNPVCNNAEELHPWATYECGHRDCKLTEFPDTLFHCSECKTIAPIEWPTNAHELWAELIRRPERSNRNWYPEGHELAVRWNLPNGQSVRDLEREREARS